MKNYWQFKTFPYTGNMVKFVNVLAISIFVLVASLAPYVSAKGAALAFAQNPEERTVSNSIFEEEIHHSDLPMIFVESIIVDISYPRHLALTSQNVISDVLKPPLA